MDVKEVKNISEESLEGKNIIKIYIFLNKKTDGTFLMMGMYRYMKRSSYELKETGIRFRRWLND